MFLKHFVLALFFLTSPTLSAQFNANWVTHPQLKGSEQAVVLFRTTFELEGMPDSFPIDISADAHFRLHVNGEWVSWGPQLGDIQHWRYDHHDLLPHLKPGENTIGIEVFNWGHYRLFGMESVRTALIVQGYGPSAFLTTQRGKKNYQCTLDTGIRGKQIRWRYDDRDIIGGLYANNPTDSLMASGHHWSWLEDGFPEGSWYYPEFVEWGHLRKNGGAFLWMLEPRTTPAQQRRPQAFKALRYSPAGVGLPKGWFLGRQSVELPANGSYRFLLDMGEVTLGFPTLRWSGGKGSIITYTWAENLFNPDKTKPQRDEVEGKIVKGYFDTVLPDGGQNRSYIPSWYRTLRYLEIRVEVKDEPLLLRAPTFERVTSSIPLTASWQSDDQDLDEIVDMSIRTVEICTQDYYLSDAYYETMQYIGDTKIQAPVWELYTGDQRHTRNALMDFHRGRNENGVLKSAYPNRYQFYHSTYSLVWVDMVYDYFQRSGDTTFVRQFLPGIAHTLSYFDGHFNRETGYLEGIPYWPFIDWYVGAEQMGMAPGANADRSTPVSLHYAQALGSAAALSDALNVDNSSAAYWRGQRERMIKTLRERCYNPERKLLAERPDQSYYDQHSSILGILLDVIPEEDQEQALEKLLREEGLGQATYYYRYYLFAALEKLDRADLFREVLQPWLILRDQGATTLVERFEDDRKPTRSEAHPWGASPALFTYRLLAGISPDKHQDGIHMSPAFGHLKQMKGYCPVQGPDAGVGFDLRLEDGGLRGSIRADRVPVRFSWGGHELVARPGGTLRIDLKRRE
ncbi:alpha-L-rhamnosidase-related protein [Neolewinella agarilytica]|uniref:Alpha-L-rhamnosidase n=1 Tax=Neolewinella agarilytica TaxID=478744 RepID=A0A1H9I3K6_9BACT|nr:family 78 glycoside hydrolase catalytic domain [Neolewinella agarilytica]SEQ69174.1 alpha-L-rhamnosidase [Neolewinella agarilytica]